MVTSGAGVDATIRSSAGAGASVCVPIRVTINSATTSEAAMATADAHENLGTDGLSTTSTATVCHKPLRGLIGGKALSSSRTRLSLTNSRRQDSQDSM